MRHDLKRHREAMRIRPNPRLVALVDWACAAVAEQIYGKKYGPWLKWAEEWRAGTRSPGACVDIARWCFDHKGSGLDGKGIAADYHALGQIAWAAKEACFDIPTSGWLVVRYIGDAMIAYGIAFPERLALMGPTEPPRAVRRRFSEGRPRPDAISTNASNECGATTDTEA